MDDKTILRVLKRMRPTVVRSTKRSYVGAFYLCCIFGEAAAKLKLGSGNPDDFMSEAYRVIQSRLGGQSTYWDWVRIKHPEKFYEMRAIYSNYSLGRNPFQEGRLQWLDSLIAEYTQRVKGAK